MARLSLLCGVMGTALATTGCFDSPPEYSVPARLPPVIDAALSDPSTSDVTTTSAAIINFSVRFRADDDDGSRVRALWVRDLPARGVFLPSNLIAFDLVTTTSLPFEDQEDRPVLTRQWPWTTSVSPGCHSMTLQLSYESNFGSTFEVEDPSLVAQVTWFFGLLDAQPGVNDPKCWPQGTP